MCDMMKSSSYFRDKEIQKVAIIGLLGNQKLFFCYNFTPLIFLPTCYYCCIYKMTVGPWWSWWWWWWWRELWKMRVPYTSWQGVAYYTNESYKIKVGSSKKETCLSCTHQATRGSIQKEQRQIENWIGLNIQSLFWLGGWNLSAGKPP